MKCPCCRTEKTGEYFHVLSTDIKDFHFNYCCTDCLVERISTPVLRYLYSRIKFRLSEEDRKEIQEMIDEAIASKLNTVLPS